MAEQRFAGIARMLTPQFLCQSCGRTDGASAAWRCSCGEPLEVVAGGAGLDLDAAGPSLRSIWRYHGMFPPGLDRETWQAVSLGEGWTPLVPIDPGRPGLLAKLDYCLPTGSFKDRGAVVMVAFAREMGVTTVVTDSSGNGAVSLAAYARRAGLHSRVYVPRAIDGGKLRQLEAYGASIHIVDTRSAASNAAQEAVAGAGGWYANHVMNPFAVHGTKTLAFEVWEQFGGRIPDVFVAPMGNGTLLLGAYMGFRELVDLGLATGMPRLVGVQAAACAPIAEAFCKAASTIESARDWGPTIATGVAIPQPSLGQRVLRALRRTDGWAVAVSEEQIRGAMHALAARGFFVEPSGAVGFAGIAGPAEPAGLGLQRAESFTLTDLTEEDVIVVVLTGGGLKA